MHKSIQRKALFSDCRTYRYALWRNWEAKAKQVLFIGLNPSTTDATQDDPTIRRCTAFAQSWGYGGFCIANLYAFCSPYPKELFKAKDPIGPENDEHLQSLIAEHDKVILIWGNDGGRTNRFTNV